VYAYRFDGYWEDIGTIKSFFEENLKLTENVPEFEFYDPTCECCWRRRRSSCVMMLHLCRCMNAAFVIGFHRTTCLPLEALEDGD
jgi:hypothetical protein